jgi:transcriptional regulator with XRE-family HTH domain
MDPMKKTTKTIGQRIEARRKAHKRSRQQCATEAGVTHGTWYRWEREGVDLTLSALERIAGILDCEATDLI